MGSSNPSASPPTSLVPSHGSPSDGASLYSTTDPRRPITPKLEVERPDSRVGLPLGGGGGAPGGGGSYYPPSNASVSPTPSEQKPQHQLQPQHPHLPPPHARQRHASDMDELSKYRRSGEVAAAALPQHQRNGGPDSISFLRQHATASSSAASSPAGEGGESPYSQQHLPHHPSSLHPPAPPPHGLVGRGGGGSAEPLYSPPLNGASNGRAPSRDIYSRNSSPAPGSTAPSPILRVDSVTPEPRPPPAHNNNGASGSATTNGGTNGAHYPPHHHLYPPHHLSHPLHHLRGPPNAIDDAELTRHQQPTQQHPLPPHLLSRSHRDSTLSPPPPLHPPSSHLTDRESPAGTVLDLGQSRGVGVGVGGGCFPSPQPLVINHQSDDEESPPSPARSEMDTQQQQPQQQLPFTNYAIHQRSTSNQSPTKATSSSSFSSRAERQSSASSSTNNHFYLPQARIQPPTPMAVENDADDDDNITASSINRRQGSPARSLPPPPQIPSLTVTPPPSTITPSSSSSNAVAKPSESRYQHSLLHHLKSTQVDAAAASSSLSSSSSAAAAAAAPASPPRSSGFERSLKRPFDTEARENLERDSRDVAPRHSPASAHNRDSSAGARDGSRDRENRDSSRDRPGNSPSASSSSRPDHRDSASALRRRRPRIPSPLPLVSNIRYNMSPPRNYFGERSPSFYSPAKKSSSGNNNGINFFSPTLSPHLFKDSAANNNNNNKDHHKDDASPAPSQPPPASPREATSSSSSTSSSTSSSRRLTPNHYETMSTSTVTVARARPHPWTGGSVVTQSVDRPVPSPTRAKPPPLNSLPPLSGNHLAVPGIPGSPLHLTGLNFWSTLSPIANVSPLHPPTTPSSSSHSYFQFPPSAAALSQAAHAHLLHPSHHLLSPSFALPSPGHIAALTPSHHSLHGSEMATPSVLLTPGAPPKHNSVSVT